MERDTRVFSHENILEQIQTAEFRNGYYVLEFYSENNKPSKIPTTTTAKFFLYPSGGTLRDSNFQLLFYDSRYDTYRGFKPPHLEREQQQ
ncbi:MAG: hypothetical protein HY276_01490 [Ignavibacteriales bacterium]|nr:hypothetical protein [Ignavibacteriales bacterium]MBI3786903.1 hypothetical protein [Ignavibacteriales bacterium]